MFRGVVTVDVAVMIGIDRYPGCTSSDRSSVVGKIRDSVVVGSKIVIVIYCFKRRSALNYGVICGFF